MVPDLRLLALRCLLLPSVMGDKKGDKRERGWYFVGMSTHHTETPSTTTEPAASGDRARIVDQQRGCAEQCDAIP